MKHIVSPKLKQLYYFLPLKIISIVLSTCILTSCQITDAITDRVGFTFRNPFFNDSNEANSKYNRNNIFEGRRIPQGNREFLFEKEQINQYDEIKLDKELYDDQKVTKFWANVYKGKKPQIKTNVNDNNISNKINKVEVKELPADDKKKETIVIKENIKETDSPKKEEKVNHIEIKETKVINNKAKETKTAKPIKPSTKKPITETKKTVTKDKVTKPKDSGKSTLREEKKIIETKRPITPLKEPKNITPIKSTTSKIAPKAEIKEVEDLSWLPIEQNEKVLDEISFVKSTNKSTTK